MKVILRAFSALILLLSLAGCGRDLGLTASDGTYLQMKVRFPETSDSETSRLIHSEADVLTITLTYPDGTVKPAEFPRNEDSEMTIQVDDLTVASGVVVKVTLGIEEYDLILTEATKTIDIAEGANSTGTMIMEPIEYTVAGTLYDKDNNLLPGTTILVKDGEPITSDASGQFSMTVSTADLANVNVFSVDVGGDNFDMTRTGLALLQNYENFTLKASHEIYLDFIVGCELYALPEATFEVIDTVTTEVIYSGSADSVGRISYQNSSYSSGNPFKVVISKSLFQDLTIQSIDESLASMTEKKLQPYIIYYNAARNDVDQLIKMNDMTGTGKVEKDITNYISGFAYEFNGSAIQNAVCDYLRGKIYVYVSYSDGSTHQNKLLVFDGWDDTLADEIVTTSVLLMQEHFVQQMDILSDGSLLVSSTYGCFLVDTVNLMVSAKWETGTNPYAFVCHGAIQDENGNIIVLGLDRLNGTTEERERQRTWLLNQTDYSWSVKAELSAENGFINLNNNIIPPQDVPNFEYLDGWHKWNSNYVSVKVSIPDTGNNFGSIYFFTENGSILENTGSPNQSPIAGEFWYAIPYGVLPDNKYYFYYVDLVGHTHIRRLDSPDDSDIETYEFYSSTSHGQFAYSYIEGA